jgi:hypothetical protein
MGDALMKGRPVCPGTTKKLPTGHVCFYRPKRSKPRKHTPRDLARITSYVACSHGPDEALCAVLTELGKTQELRELLEQFDDVEKLIAQALPSDEPGDPWDALMEVLLWLAVEVGVLLKKMKASWVWKQLLKRFLFLKVVMEIFERLAKLTEVLEQVLLLVRSARVIVEKCSCDSDQQPLPGE